MSTYEHTDIESPASGTEQAAALGRLTTKIEPWALTADTSLTVTRVSANEELHVTDLERFLTAPRVPRGAAVLHQHDDFAEYVTRLGTNEHTTLWADESQARVTAVLNDHEDSDTGGWRDHRVELQLAIDPDWFAWTKLDRKLVSQQQLADHLEDLAHTVVSPDAATMIEVATSFRARRNASFAQAVRLDNGDTQLSYEETTTATAGRKGNLEVPSEFMLSLPVFKGTNRVELKARLRYQIADGRLAIGYALHRPDLVLSDAFAQVLGEVRTQCGEMPILLGAAPKALR